MPERDPEPGYDPSNPNPAGDNSTPPYPAPAGYYWYQEDGRWLLSQRVGAPPASNTPPPAGNTPPPAAGAPPPAGARPGPNDHTEGGYSPRDGYVWHWDGTAWTEVPGPVATYRPPAGGRGDPSGKGFDGWPSYEMPSYYAPEYREAAYIQPQYEDMPGFDPGAAFTYEGWNAPDPSAINTDPSYRFRVDQGLKALSAQRAGQGTFLSGATGKALEDYGQNAASQEYGNIWNRSLTNYDTNRNNAFGNWSAQYGQRRDTYGFDQANNSAKNAFNLSEAGSHNTFNQNNASGANSFSLADSSGRNSFNQSNSQFDFSGRQQRALAEFNDLFQRWNSQGNWLSALATSGDD